jgi:hypothetical protein
VSKDGVPQLTWSFCFRDLPCFENDLDFDMLAGFFDHVGTVTILEIIRLILGCTTSSSKVTLGAIVGCNTEVGVVPREASCVTVKSV